jgi:chromosome segregation ATPase
MPPTSVPGTASDAIAGELEPADDELAATLLDLRHRQLTMRDHIIGQEAELGRLRAEVRHLRFENQRIHEAVRQLSAEAQALRTENAAIRTSTTWHVGRVLVAPIARVKRSRGQVGGP